MNAFLKQVPFGSRPQLHAATATQLKTVKLSRRDLPQFNKAIPQSLTFLRLSNFFVPYFS
jgi:hypothetical protein